MRTTLGARAYGRQDERLVIDAFSMPGATDEDLATMRGVVESIRFEVP